MSMKKRVSYLPRGQRMLNAVFGTMVRLGMIPGAHLLSVPGRKSGKIRTTPIYVLRYEDMLNDTRKAFGNLARHLLLRPTEKQLETAIDRSSFDRLQAQEQEHGFVEKPEMAKRFFREGKAGQWREQLTRRQVRQIVTTHSPQMRRFGYITPEIEHLVR